MAVKLNHNGFLSSSSSNLWLSENPRECCYSCRIVSNLDNVIFKYGGSRRRFLVRYNPLWNSYNGLKGPRRDHFSLCKSRRRMCLMPNASADEGVTVNGSPQVSTSTELEKMRVKLSKSLQEEDFNDGLVQSVHDAARVFELAIKEYSSFFKVSWFPTAWLGVDMNAWVKALSYQAAVYSLLQAAIEISSNGDGGDNINVFVQRSLLRLSAPLESLIRDELSSKQQGSYDWFWSEQVPAVVTSFVNYFKGDPRFSATIPLPREGMSSGSGNASDISLLMLALTCIAAITKVGPAKVSCSQFFSMISEITGRLMDMLVDFIPIDQAYNSLKDIGIHREFLVHFGPRAAAYRVKTDRDSEEVVFWVNLVQKQLQKTIDRERIWSRLTTSESIEVLEKDLAIFGFFIALGRSTRSFLSTNGFDTLDNPVEDFIRYLIGASVLYYPQLASISSYQLYVEVVCEELDWLPFYPGLMGSIKQYHRHHCEKEAPPNAEAVSQALDVCSHWIHSFIKHSKWLENPSNVKAAKFLSRGHHKLLKHVEEFGIIKDRHKTIEGNSKNDADRSGSKVTLSAEKESNSFDKALESVEEALIRLEKLLQELHVSSTTSGKEQLKAACSDLEKIRKLKKEAEFLEASFRAKAASLKQDDDEAQSRSSVSEQQQVKKGKNRKNATEIGDTNNRVVSGSHGFWGLIPHPLSRKPELATSLDENDGTKQSTLDLSVTDLETNEIRRFEVLRNELIQLEERVQRSTYQSECVEDTGVIEDGANYANDGDKAQLIQIQKKENLIEKSFGKIKEASTDVWQGTQLLAFDVAASTGLLRRVLIGDELTEKEKKVLKRTITDLASVVPIGFLMLLPVTAVGHAAMLAAIQRYVPALIPSTYAPERLDLLRQLEKMKEMKTSDVCSDEKVEELA